jgi:hypothetical protein
MNETIIEPSEFMLMVSEVKNEIEYHERKLKKFRERLKILEETNNNEEVI